MGPSAGTGNTLFRLGDYLVARLPRHRRTVAAMDVELRWLPQLAAQVPLAVPVPVAAGAPDEAFPRPWAASGGPVEEVWIASRMSTR
ncbi:MAG: phosphotransferase [Mycobacteriales bacterium]